MYHRSSFARLTHGDIIGSQPVDQRMDDLRLWESIIFHVALPLGLLVNELATPAGRWQAFCGTDDCTGREKGLGIPSRLEAGLWCKRVELLHEVCSWCQLKMYDYYGQVLPAG